MTNKKTKTKYKSWKDLIEKIEELEEKVSKIENKTVQTEEIELPNGFVFTPSKQALWSEIEAFVGPEILEDLQSVYATPDDLKAATREDVERDLGLRDDIMDYTESVLIHLNIWA